MSQNDAEVMREAFDRWNRGDISGHDGMREWRAEIDRNYELHEVSADDVQQVGPKLLVLGSVRSRGRASNIELRHPFGWVCELRDGALIRMHFYSSHAEARDAVGLGN